MLPTTIRWNDQRTGLIILDQTLLPEERVERELRSLEDVEEAITTLRVRGAPLIGITAAMAVAALARSGNGAPGGVAEWCDRLERTRPTAVNLRWALERMRAVTARHGDGTTLVDALEAEAEAIRLEDAELCRRLGEHGVALLRDGDRVLTHCNAGALATGGMGTALAPVYVAHERGMRVAVVADETRPLLQGSRLTAWELEQAGVDVTVIADDMAAALFGTRPPDIVLVGADRIAANGDVANKVGTYGLAVLAAHHGVPFYVLAPTSTVDLDTPDGASIPIEHRDPEEIRRGFGRLTAPEGVSVWSPAFDVTPASLITGIVTEHGIARTPFEAPLREAVAAARRRRDGQSDVAARGGREGGAEAAEQGGRKGAHEAAEQGRRGGVEQAARSGPAHLDAHPGREDPTRTGVAEAILTAARRMHRTGLIAGLAGNFSARVSAHEFLVTPAGRHKGDLAAGDLVRAEVDPGTGAVPGASSELPFHRGCYRADPEVGAVAHTHAPALVALGARGLDLVGHTPEVAKVLGRVAYLPFLESGSEALGRAVEEAVAGGARVILLGDHGAITTGHDIADAAHRMELAELTAYTVLLAEDQAGDLARARLESLLGS